MRSYRDLERRCKRALDRVAGDEVLVLDLPAERPTRGGNDGENERSEISRDKNARERERERERKK